MKHNGHIIRLVVVLAAVAIGFFAVRSFMVPDSFGIQGDYTYGYHRAASDMEQAARPAIYQGPGKCRNCHEEQYLLWEAGEHAAAGCETCHGSWEAHNNNTKGAMKAEGSIESCMICHAMLEARPASVKQIGGLEQHVADTGRQLEPDMNCVSCHNPHDPKQ